VVACTGALILLTGCTLGEIFASYGEPVELQSEDVIGTWQSSGGERTIIFAEDGTFTAVNLPREEFDEFVNAGTGQIDASGTWTTKPPIVHEGRVANEVWLLDVELTGSESGGRGAFPIEAYRQDSAAVWLFFFYDGSGGSSWTAYEKCADACPSATPSPS
jgi:hypothetical protein